MDRLRKEDGRTPFVLAQPQIASIARAATDHDDVVAFLALAAALIPCPADLLAMSRISSFDPDRSLLTIPNPRGERVRIGIGSAARATLSLSIGARRTGYVFADGHGDRVRADRDAEDHANELLAPAGSVPTLRWTFRSLREGVFACLCDGGVPHDVASAMAGLGTTPIGAAASSVHQARQRDASDWWATSLGVVATSPLATPSSGRRRPGGGESDAGNGS